MKKILQKKTSANNYENTKIGGGNWFLPYAKVVPSSHPLNFFQKLNANLFVLNLKFVRIFALNFKLEIKEKANG